MGILEHKRILIIEDDEDLLEIMSYVFLKEKAQVYTAEDGPEGLRQFYAHHPDLILLDLMLPRISGWEVCRQIRQVSDVPLVIVSARTRNDDIIEGLACGADDFITKPFNAKVLIAQIEAVVRRSTRSYHGNSIEIYDDKYLRIDLDRRRVQVRNQDVKLSRKEFGLLSHLFRNAGRVLTFQQILAGVWGWEYQDNVEYVRSYVWRLRQKLEEDPLDPTYLVTEHGVGYRFIKQSLG